MWLHFSFEAESRLPCCLLHISRIYPAVGRGLCDLCLLAVVRRDMENRVCRHPSLCSLAVNCLGERPPAGSRRDLIRLGRSVVNFQEPPSETFPLGSHYFVPFLTGQKPPFPMTSLTLFFSLPPSLPPFCLLPTVIILMDLWNNALLWFWFVFLQLVIFSISYLKMFI